MSSSNLTPGQKFIRMVMKINSDPNSYIYEIPSEETLNDDVSTEPNVQKNPFLETLHRRLDQMMEAEGEVEEKNDSSDSDDGDSSDDEFLQEINGDQEQDLQPSTEENTVGEPRDLAESVCSILRRRMEVSWDKEKITPQIAGVYPGASQVNQPPAEAAEIRELKLALEKERKEHKETLSAGND
ncbi:hypothetical protein GCK72_003361 [Caenorhabditis remanei]|uniref:Uncharacterized protein n=1 Tax=Caenorhabditis remanei TaxID=31234 RepID=A0A6A5HX74_CAERE|nr:hypothetical protein GCK72_003361 [Caenorhabditis remanei]KAF1771534.1 hypothetical protein GCK72_003361 [Caenorhabditis remanei]